MQSVGRPAIGNELVSDRLASFAEEQLDEQSTNLESANRFS